jgi:hypothetical protein
MKRDRESKEKHAQLFEHLDCNVPACAIKEVSKFALRLLVKVARICALHLGISNHTTCLSPSTGVCALISTPF